MTRIIKWPTSSVARKQIVACTGLLILCFVLAHLAGNMLIFAGPETFNAYAAKLASLRPLLSIFEIGLIALALIHITTTLFLLLENRKARGTNYAVSKAVGPTILGAKWMIITGPIILIFVLFHLWDFTFAEHGARNLVNNQDLGLYGVVYNSFRQPIHSLIYIAALIALAIHLTHAIQSALQTFGLNSNKCFPFLKLMSIAVGIIVALAYIIIPISVLLNLIKP
ncbi:MAG: succinate dehydrogenase cytochrome b subunit [Planctomycetes bacterium]|nr:succinate dehydrogenase cytochrome b subunit [Planctomycetota bacterium]